MLQPHLDTAMNAARDIVNNIDGVEFENSNQIFTRVTHRLTNEYNFNIQDARDAAAKAIAEYDSRNIDGAFDLKSSTANCLFIKVDGQTRVVSLAEVVNNLEFL